jgi:AcrR family transcriptional regulator
VADASHPTRSRLIEVGLALAESGSLAATSVNHIIDAAGVSKGAFYVHFKDRGEYLAALHRTFHASVNAEIRQAMAAYPPGARRLRRGAEAYLDACLRARGVRAMLLDARSEPAIAAQMGDKIDAFVEVAAVDFRALDAPEPAAAARLLVAMVREVAIAELGRGRVEPELRQALWHLAQLDAEPST